MRLALRQENDMKIVACTAMAVSFGTLTTFGCLAEVDDDTPITVETVESELRVGDWAGPFSNGDAGIDPVRWMQSDGTASVICEVFEAGDSRYHPGKMWNGTCRYEYSRKIKYSGSYYTLQRPASGILRTVSNTGYTPDDAIGSSPSSLAVCGTSSGTGKVWQGSCLWEYADRLQTSTSFSFFVSN